MSILSIVDFFTGRAAGVHVPEGSEEACSIFTAREGKADMLDMISRSWGRAIQVDGAVITGINLDGDEHKVAALVFIPIKGHMNTNAATLCEKGNLAISAARQIAKEEKREKLIAALDALDAL